MQARLGPARQFCYTYKWSLILRQSEYLIYQDMVANFLRQFVADAAAVVAAVVVDGDDDDWSGKLRD